MSERPPTLSIELPAELLEQLAHRAAEIVVERLQAAQPNGSPYLTIAEAADYARCTRQRIYDLRSSGRLTRHGDGTRALILRTELDDLLARRPDRRAERPTPRPGKRHSHGSGASATTPC